MSPEESAGSAPRRRPRWAPSPLVVYSIPGACFLVAFGFAVAAAEFLAGLHLGEGPPDGTGQVTSASSKHNSRTGSTRGTVHFTYVRDGETVPEVCRVNLKDLETIHPGDTFPVYRYRVLRERAMIAPCAVRARGVALGGIPLGIMGLLAAAGGVLLARFIAGRNDVVRNGRAVAGTVLSVDELASRRGRAIRYRLRYRYGDREDPVVKAFSVSSLKGRGLGRPPRAGDALVVLEDPRNPRRHVVWSVGDPSGT